LSASGLFFIIGAACITAVSNVLLRIAVMRAGGFGISAHGIVKDLWQLIHQPWFVVGMLLYGLATLTWIRVLSTENFATAYVLLVSIAFLAVNVVGYLVFREPITVQKLIGIGVILMGIVMVAQPF
jgi:multidrug transporter EmrE-like cation transporter